MLSLIFQQTMNRMPQINAVIGNSLGVGSAGGGLWTFLNHNAGALGVVFTGLTFLGFVVFNLISMRLKFKEHEAKMGTIQKSK